MLLPLLYVGACVCLVPLKERLSRRDLPQRLALLRESVWHAERQPVVASTRRPYRRIQKLNEDQVAELVATYRAGGTVSGLARHFGIDRTTVRAVLDREQVARRSQGRVLSLEEIERASQLYREGLNLRAVGAELGVDYRVVRRGLMAAGVRVRQGGRRLNDADGVEPSPRLP